MAENDDIRRGFRDIQIELKAQGVLKNIRECDGTSSKKFKQWLRDVERAGEVMNADGERLKSFALQTLKGPAAEYCSRVMRLNPALDWNGVKASLCEQYSDTSDAYVAKCKLKGLTQTPSESIRNFTERIFSLADEAFVGENLNHPLIQTMLVDILIEGVLNDAVSRKLIRDRPGNLQEALRLAVREQTDQKSFDVRRGIKRHEEAMEVNAVNQNKIDSLATAVLDLGERLASVLAISSGKNYPKPQQKQEGRKGPFVKFKWTSDGKPICHYCNKIGHKQTECRKKQFNEKQKTGHAAQSN